MVPDAVAWPFWNAERRRLRAPWRLLVHLILFAVIGLGGFLGIEFAAPALLAATTGERLLTGLAVALSVAVASRWLDRRPLADLGVRGPMSDLWAGVALGGGAMAGVFLTELAAGWVRVTGVAGSPAGTSFPLALLTGLVLMAAVGAYEELLVRGYWLTNLAEGARWLPGVDARRAVAGGVALTGVVFGVLHAANPNATLASALTIAVAGIVLGGGYAVTGSLGLSVGVHAAWNFAQAFVFGFPTSGVDFEASVVVVTQSGPTALTGGPFGPEGGAVGLFWLIFAGAGMAWWVRRTRGDLRIRTEVAEPDRLE